ncbi:chalcone isomerase family protein [Ramlibacter sp. MAHUQ-53]|uniref:chalcone isomerase family protein n=1 Tax=unclassified Ramlibacter TaxID=2617605 RepID=UPI00363A3308
MWSSTRWRVDRALLLALALWLCLGALPPAAASPGPHPQLAGSRLQGEATLRYFGLRVYHARLWTRPGFQADQPEAQPLVLELEYLRDFAGSAIAGRSLDEMRRAGPLPEPLARRWQAEMARVFPDVKAGDRLAGLHLPGEGARFWHNGRPVGQVDDPDFGRRFFGIWLAPTTSQPALRLALLGLGERAGP